MAEWVHLEDMEKDLLVDDYKVEYEGFFDYQELLRLVDQWAQKHDYFKEVKTHKEKVTPKGRNITLGIDFQRKFSHIHHSFVVVEIEIENMTDHVIELDGVRTRLNEGEVEVAFFGYLYTHLKSRWETKPNVAFVRRVIDKFIYKLERSKYPGTVVSETMDLAQQIRSFLNLYKHRVKEHEKQGQHGHGHEEQGKQEEKSAHHSNHQDHQEAAEKKENTPSGHGHH